MWVHCDGWEQHYELLLQRMREAGINQLIAELQRQVDEFLAINGIDRYNTIAR